MSRKSIEGTIAVRLPSQAIPGLGEAPIGPWAKRAGCAATDSEIFFPPHGDPATQARRICANCPVRDDCLAYALDADEKFGIWGGLDPRERQSLRRRLRSQRSRSSADGRGAA
jgi:WhiB family transcriptional regulator, redox-sensing transcriptional regulator